MIDGFQRTPVTGEDVVVCLAGMAARRDGRRDEAIDAVEAVWEGDELIVRIAHAGRGLVEVRLGDVCADGPEFGRLGAGDVDDSGVAREWVAHLVEAGTWDVRVSPPVVVATHHSVFGPRRVELSASAMTVTVVDRVQPSSVTDEELAGRRAA